MKSLFDKFIQDTENLLNDTETERDKLIDQNSEIQNMIKKNLKQENFSHLKKLEPVNDLENSSYLIVKPNNINPVKIENPPKFQESHSLYLQDSIESSISSLYKFIYKSDESPKTTKFTFKSSREQLEKNHQTIQSNKNEFDIKVDNDIKDEIKLITTDGISNDFNDFAKTIHQKFC